MNVNMASDNDHFGMNCAGGGATIHFSLQGKGGVGKSVMASWLAQYFQSKDIPVICIDTDPVNATLSQFKDLHADHLNVLKAGTINEKQFDALVERGRRVFIHLVVTGGQAMADTLAGFKQVAETAPANSIIVWLNEYFGEVERYGKRFEDLQVAQQFASRLAGAVRIRERNRHTFGDDVKMMLERSLILPEVLPC